MLLRCLCGAETMVSIHKDGYEVVRFLCTTCKYQKFLKHEGEVRITMQNGDFFYVKAAQQKRRIV